MEKKVLASTIYYVINENENRIKLRFLVKYNHKFVDLSKQETFYNDKDAKPLWLEDELQSGKKVLIFKPTGKLRSVLNQAFDSYSFLIGGSKIEENQVVINPTYFYNRDRLLETQRAINSEFKKIKIKENAEKFCSKKIILDTDNKEFVISAKNSNEMSV